MRIFYEYQRKKTTENIDKQASHGVHEAVRSYECHFVFSMVNRYILYLVGSLWLYLQASNLSLWGLRPWSFPGRPFFLLCCPDFIYGFLQPIRRILVLFDAINVRQRWLHQHRLVSSWWTFGIKLHEATQELFDNGRMPGSDTNLWWIRERTMET